MDELCRGRGERKLGGAYLLGWLAAGLAGTASTGCGRVLTIEKDDYINNAMHKDRPVDSRRGDPMEVTIVCVTPKDLTKELQVNDALSPKAETAITADVWYDRRPKFEDQGKKVEDCEGRFRLPKDQVFVLTDESNAKAYFGKKVGGLLRGAKIDGKKSMTVSFPFSGPLHDDRSVIYVFPKFISPEGKVLPVKPAKFDPPGAYTHKLFIKIGVDQGKFGDKSQHYGQYIENKTERKLHGHPKEGE